MIASPKPRPFRLLARLGLASLIAAVPLAGLGSLWLLSPQKAQSNTLFAQQTRHQCGACHLPGQEPAGAQGLTPYGVSFNQCVYTPGATPVGCVTQLDGAAQPAPYAPPAPNYPSPQPYYPPGQPNYPPAQPNYPPQQPNYPPPQPNYPPQGYTPPPQPYAPAPQPYIQPPQPYGPPPAPESVTNEGFINKCDGGDSRYIAMQQPNGVVIRFHFEDRKNWLYVTVPKGTVWGSRCGDWPDHFTGTVN